MHHIVYWTSHGPHIHIYRMNMIGLVPDENGEMSEGSVSAEIQSLTDATDNAEDKTREDSSDTDLEIEGECLLPCLLSNPSPSTQL